MSATPWGIYVHVPYCSSRCGYCDFNTYVPGEAADGTQAAWSAAARAEVQYARRQVSTNAPVSTIFIGGGTPTLIPPADLASVISAIDTEFGLDPDVEITVEANPETITEPLVEHLLTAGVNRLSIGMQSADETVLAVLDRRHSAGGALRAVHLAQVGGFERISLDLIYGTPGETAKSWRATTELAVNTGVTHISAYALKVETGTRLHRQVADGAVAGIDDDQAACAYDIADEVFTAAGLPWYEISNWARPSHECRHNLGYWRSHNWWGIGPGAHSHMDKYRWWNEKLPQKWVEALGSGCSPQAGTERLSADDQLTEFVMLRVRLREGLPLGQLRTLAGVTDDRLEQISAQLVTQGLAQREFHVGDPEADALRLTLAGRRTADAVTLRILAAVS